jgi:hypothetical protein
LTPSDLTLVVSPYLVGPADPAIHAAAVIATRVVTLLPTPPGFTDSPAGRTRVRAAAHACPHYLRLLDAWSWSIPLWHQGVLRGAIAGDAPAKDLAGVESALRADPRLRLVAAAIKPGLLEHDTEYLTALSADILKGGADPGVTTLVAAALDRFCARHNFVSVRAGPGPLGVPSVVQRGESALSRRTFAIAIPVPVQASGSWLCRLRTGLAPEIAALRAGIVAALSGDTEPLARAGAKYAEAFARWRREAGPAVTDDDLGRRVVDATVSVTGSTLPVDAAIRASAAAIRASGFGASQPAPPPSAEPDRFPVLTIRRMNVQPDVSTAREHQRAQQGTADGQ